ncbi:MAG TPA: hypothetical protein VMF62_19805 [Acetobacteraceae bacterium]|nr:hypothetical protein [Acetobacteraceae bacterium]
MSTKGVNGADIATEIQRLETEIAAIETAALPVADQVAMAARRLEDDLAFFTRHGFTRLGYQAGEAEAYFRRQVAGALMALGGDVMQRMERERIERAHKASGRLALSEAERERRLAELRARLRKLHAELELAVRRTEAGSELVGRIANFDAELYLRPADIVERIARGEEV